MDYCCGKQTLARAAARHDVDIDIIEAQPRSWLEMLHFQKDWRARRSAGDIIDHIVVRYHDRHREQLPELILQATVRNASTRDKASQTSL